MAVIGDSHDTSPPAWTLGSSFVHVCLRLSSLSLPSLGMGILALRNLACRTTTKNSIYEFLALTHPEFRHVVFAAPTDPTPLQA